MWPLPQIEEIFVDLSGGQFFTTLELFSGYWKIRLEEGVKEMTTFICRFGTFQFEVIPFGLINYPSIFQRLMHELLKDLPPTREFLDDIFVLSATLSEHEEHVGQVLRRFHSHGLNIKLKKCEFELRRVSLLGHIIDGSGVRMDPGKVSVISGAAVPTNHTKLC